MADDDQDEFDALLVSQADKYKPLIERHPIPELDGRVVFNGADGKHEYRVDGLLAPRSGTAIIKAAFQPSCRASASTSFSTMAEECQQLLRRD